LLQALIADPTWEVCCFAGGTHWSASFGRTADEFADLPELRVLRVDHLVAGDGPADVAETAGRAVAEFGRAFAEHPIDLLFVLGDRPEMLAAALAATIHAIPLAHLHGGDTTAGAYDNACRHAITKLSHLHFPALPQHAAGLRAMGEEDWRIHPVGGLAIDALRDFSPEPLEELNAATALDWSRPTFIVAFYPETLAAVPPARQIEEVLAALAGFDTQLLLLGPNADVGHDAVRSGLARLASTRAGAVLLPALGQRRFWSCLARAQVLIGNSSAGLLEAASFRLPVVNVGDRQTGRVRPVNVLDSPLDRAAIAAAVEKAATPGFRSGLGDLVNPYGDGRAAERIVSALHGLPARRGLLVKP
jgi:UDP-hydrolysing UDP-N-acetyl-D-glucosamine 2-epimerase